MLMPIKIVLCHYRNDSKADIPKQILLISKQKISSGNRIYFFAAKTHNPNPKLEIPAVPFNSEVSETRETGALKDALVQQEIYVTPSD